MRETPVEKKRHDLLNKDRGHSKKNKKLPEVKEEADHCNERKNSFRTF